MGQKIFIINGGGQYVRQGSDFNLPVYFEIVENSDWPVKAKCFGQDSYTNVMWATDFETLQRWANDWAGKKIELIEKTEE